MYLFIYLFSILMTFRHTSMEAYLISGIYIYFFINWNLYLNSDTKKFMFWFTSLELQETRRCDMWLKVVNNYYVYLVIYLVV